MTAIIGYRYYMIDRLYLNRRLNDSLADSWDYRDLKPRWHCVECLNATDDTERNGGDGGLPAVLASGG